MTAFLTVPRLQIQFGAGPLEGSEASSIVGCRISQRACAPDQAEVTFLAAAPVGAAPGEAMRIAMPDSPTPLFTGSISAIEHVLTADGLTLARVRGYDRLHRLRVSGRVRAWKDTSVAALAVDVGAGIGLSVQSSADGPNLPHLIQSGQSDLELLVELAERAGLGLHLRQDTLHVYDLAEGVGEAVALQWGTTLREASIDHNPSAGPRPVRVQGEGIGYLAGVSTGDELDHSDGSGDADGGARELPGTPVLASGEPSSLARAERRRQEAAEWVLRGVAAGDPRLRPGAIVRLSGPAAVQDIARTFVLTEVVHTVDDVAGFVSTLSSSPTARAAKRQGGGATMSLATVIDVDDSEGAGRVSVTLDAYDDAETGWLPVLTPGAGPDSGFIVQPDVGARVLVLSGGLDPGLGVVLGALYTGATPENAIDGGRSRRQFWRTAGGQRIGLDDAASTLTVADNAGSSVRLEPGLVTVESVGDLHLSAPGKAIVITAATVDFVEG